MSTIRTAVLERLDGLNFHASTGTGRKIEFGNARRERSARWRPF